MTNNVPAARGWRALLRDRTVLSWSLYDWANSAFATTVMAGFFPLYFRLLVTREPITERDADVSAAAALAAARGGVFLASSASSSGGPGAGTRARIMP